MNIFDAYVNDKPSCFYKIDEPGTSFPNLAGDTRALIASVASTKSSNTPIVRGSSGPVLVGGDKTLKIPTDRLTPKTKNSPVSFECWVVPRLVGPPTEQITSVTNLVTNPSGRNTSGTVVVRENLSVRPNLETESTGWAPFWEASWSRSQDWSDSGDWSFKVTRTPGGHSEQGMLYQVYNANLAPGEVYTLSATFMAPDGGVITFRPRISFSGTPSVSSRGEDAVLYDLEPGVPKRLVVSFTLPALGPTQTAITAIGFDAISTGLPDGWVLYGDSLVIEKGLSDGTYFDGSTPASGDFTYTWSGTPNASTSKELASGYPSSQWSRMGSISQVYVYRSSEGPRSVNPVGGTFGLEAVTPTITLQQGDRIRWVGRVKPNFNANLTPLLERKAPYANQSAASFSAPADVWTPFDISIIVGTSVAGTSAYGTGLYQANASIGASITIDSMMTIVGNYEGPYFDGDTPQDNNARYAWDGTPDASTSTSYAPGPVEIMSHEGTGDGLVFDGDFIKFSVNFATADPAEVKWQVPDKLSAYHLVGVYNGHKLSLYVNGFIVDEVDLTAEQMLDSLDTVSEEAVVIGSSDTYEILLVDAPAIFDHALSADQVAEHYLVGTDVRDAIDNIMSFGGKAFTFDDNDRNILYTQQFDLTTGLFVDTNSQDGIRPAFDDDGLSRAGTWTGSIPISLTGSTDLAGVKLDWNGDGYYLVEASLDTGESWIEVQNGELIQGTEGLDTTGKEIDVRITFDGGIENDISVVRDIYAVAYEDYVIRSDNSNRTVTASEGSVTSTLVSSPIQAYQNAGLSMPGSTATIDGGETTQTIELWMKFEDDTTGDILPGLSWDGTDFIATGATLYMNGETGPVSPVVGEWVHLVLVLDDPTTDDIQLGSDVNIQIGLLGLYESELSADHIARLYASYFGAPVTTVVEPGGLSVQEVSTPYHLYDYNWQIVSGGR